MLPGQLKRKWAAEAKAKRRKAARLPPFTPARQTRRMLLNKQELKVFDTTLSWLFDLTAEIPATGQLALVQVGDTLNSRDGAVINAASLQLRGVVTLEPAASASAATVCWVQVMLDRQPNGAAATITGDVNSVLSTNSMTTAFPHVPNQHRFKCLKRMVFPLNSQAGVTTAYNKVVIPFDEYIQFKKPIVIRYNASTGAVGDIATNNLFLIAGCDGNADDTANMAGNCRLRFTD